MFQSGSGFNVIYTPPLGHVAELLTANCALSAYGTGVCSVGLQFGLGGPVVDIARFDTGVPLARAAAQGQWLLEFGDNVYINGAVGGFYTANIAGFVY